MMFHRSHYNAPLCERCFGTSAKTISQRYLFGFSLTVAAFSPGSISIPSEPLSAPIIFQELDRHCHFLARPRLRGRNPRSIESSIA